MTDFQKKREQLLKQSQGVIFPYSDSWVQSHQAFAAKMWPGKTRRRDEAYNRWKFKGPLTGDVNGLLLAVVNNQVVGQLGLIPDRLRVDGRVYGAQWACDLMVDDDFRQKGLGSMLFAVAMDRGLVTLGSEPSPLADITMARIGYKPLIGPIKMVLPIDPSVIMRWVLKARFKRIIPIMAKVVRPYFDFKNRKRAKKSVKGILLGGWKDVAERISAHQASITKPHILHDTAFLNWRYSVPFKANIQTLCSQQGGYAICEGTKQAFYVYAWQAFSLQEAQSLFTTILQRAQSENCQYILAYANNQNERSLLKKNGFLSMRTPIKVIYHTTDRILDHHRHFHYCMYDSDGNL